MMLQGFVMFMSHVTRLRKRYFQVKLTVTSKNVSILSKNQSINIEKFNIFWDQNWTIKKSKDFTKTYAGMKFF